MPLPADGIAWERLGTLLAGRRVQISPRYANRRTFAAERSMNWRTLHDVEHAKRTNFKPETMRAFESAYMLVPGSLDRTLAGGDLEPLPDAAPRLSAVPSPPSAAEFSPDLDDRVIELMISKFPPRERDALESLWRLEHFSREERMQLMFVILTHKPGNDIPGARHGEAG